MFLKIMSSLRPANRLKKNSKHIMKSVYFKTYLSHFWANSKGAKYNFKVKRKR